MLKYHGQARIYRNENDCGDAGMFGTRDAGRQH